MSYNKNTWVTGDIITAEKLNNMETGIENASSGGSSGSLIVTATDDGEKWTLDKTWSEITSALTNGTMILMHYPYDAEHSGQDTAFGIVTGYAREFDFVSEDPSAFNVYTLDADKVMCFISDSADGYPIRIYD